MRIHVQSLPLNQDFSTQFEIPTAVFVDKNLPYSSTDPQFLTPAVCKVTLRKIAEDEIILTYSTDTLIDATCNRCTELYQIPFHLESVILCKPMTHSPTEQEDEDEGLVFFDKHELHLDQIIREQVLLALPMQYVCDENCEGLCPGCGENLNDGEHECSKMEKMIEHKAKLLG